MPRYALIMTADEKLLPGVNAVLNGLKYYDNSCEFHLLYWDSPAFRAYIKSVEQCREFPLFRPVCMQDWLKSWHIPMDQKSVHYLKFYRHLYPAWESELEGSEAVAIFDADMCVVNNLDWYFEIAAKTGKILIPNNSRSKQQIETCETLIFDHACNPPIYSMPFFYNPYYYREKLKQIPEIALKIGRSEMPTLNYLFYTQDMVKDMIILPNHLWVGTNWRKLRLGMKEIAGRRYLVVAGDDRLNSFHGRWWTQKFIDRDYVGQKEDAKKTIKLFYEFYRFFNTELYHRIDWKWGELR